MLRSHWLAGLLFFLFAPGFLTTHYTRAHNSLHLEAFAFLAWGIFAIGVAASFIRVKNIQLEKSTLTVACLLFGLPAAVLLVQSIVGLTMPYTGVVMVALYYLAVAAFICWLGGLVAAWSSSIKADNVQNQTLAADLLSAGLKATVAIAFASALVGIAQYLLLPISEFWVSPVTRLGASYGNLRQPNLFALLGVLGLAALIILHHKALRPSVKITSVVLFVYVVLIAGVVLSTSRAGTLLIGFVSVWGIVESVRARRPLWLFILAIPVYFALRQMAIELDQSGWYPFYGTVRPGLISTAIEGDSWRQAIWTRTWALIQAHPMWGVGFGELDFAMFTETLPVPRESATEHAHNIFLQIAVELGLPVAVAWTGLLVFVAVRSRSAIRTFNGRALIFLLLVVLVHNLLEYPLWYAYFLLPCAFALGILTQIGTGTADQPQALAEHQNTEDAVGGNPYAKATAFGAVLTVALVLFGLWDYSKVSPSYALNAKEPLYQRVTDGYKSVLFLNLADYAALGLTGIAPATAPVQLRLANRLAHFRTDPQVIAAQAAAAALSGQTQLAQAVAYRLWLKDKEAAERLRLGLMASQLPQAQALAVYLAAPVFVAWPRSVR
jgi:O-antigen ligase